MPRSLFIRMQNLNMQNMDSDSAGDSVGLAATPPGLPVCHDATVTRILHHTSTNIAKLEASHIVLHIILFFLHCHIQVIFQSHVLLNCHEHLRGVAWGWPLSSSTDNYAWYLSADRGCCVQVSGSLVSRFSSGFVRLSQQKGYDELLREWCNPLENQIHTVG